MRFFERHAVFWFRFKLPGSGSSEALLCGVGRGVPPGEAPLLRASDRRTGRLEAQDGHSGLCMCVPGAPFAACPASLFEPWGLLVGWEWGVWRRRLWAPWALVPVAPRGGCEWPAGRPEHSADRGQLPSCPRPVPPGICLAPPLPSLAFVFGAVSERLRRARKPMRAGPRDDPRGSDRAKRGRRGRLDGRLGAPSFAVWPQARFCRVACCG